MRQVVIALTLGRRAHNLNNQNKQRYAHDKSAKHQVQLCNNPDGYASPHHGKIAVDHLLLGGKGNLDGVCHLRQDPEHQQPKQHDQRYRMEPSRSAYPCTAWAPLPMVDVTLQHSPTFFPMQPRARWTPRPLPGSHYTDIQGHVKENCTFTRPAKPNT